MKRYFVFVLLIAFVAVGCSPSPDEITQQTAVAETQIAEAWTPTSTNTSTPSPTPTLTPSPTLTPTSTVTPDITRPPSSFPDFFSLPISNQPLLSSSDDPNCQLPCWHGVTPGESTLADVQAMYNTVLNFEEDHRLVPLLEEGISRDDIIPGLYHVETVWDIEAPDDRMGWFSITVVVDDNLETGVVQGIDISQNNIEQYPISSPQQIIQQLGAPDYIGVATYRIGQSRRGLLSLYLVYTNGLSIRQIYIQVPTREGETFTYVPVCLSTVPDFTYAYLVPPFDLAGGNVTITQQEWIFDSLTSGSWGAVEDQLDMTIDEFVEFISQPEPCLEIDFNAAPFG